jgi:DcuC family C4-dicarboxylate transporter
LLNPGAPELASVTELTARAAAEKPPFPVSITQTDCVARILPLLLVQVAVATLVFWWLSLRAERKPAASEPVADPQEKPAEDPIAHINPLKAAVPVVPLVLLMLVSPAFRILEVPPHWLVAVPAELDEVTRKEPGVAAQLKKFDSRLIGAAMLVGVVAAALTDRRAAPRVVGSFFEGTGYAFTHIISLIVTANCFGEGVKLIGLAEVVKGVVAARPDVLLPLAGVVSWSFAVVSGSGMAATQSLFGFFARPALELGMHPAHVGAVVSLSAAAGRTMSPVAAVTLMSALLTRTNPIELVQRVALPLLAAAVVMVVVAIVTGSVLP